MLSIPASAKVDPLRRLCPELSDSSGLVIIAAHADDEVIGAGAQLPSWRDTRLIHVTDGAPLQMLDATNAGFRRREDYAQARRRELESVLALAEIPARQVFQLGFVDQQSTRHLNEIVLALLSLLPTLGPVAVMTHPYEGGHPDHDATAFAVHLACRFLWNDPQPPPTVLEFTSYFNRAGNMETRQFLPAPGVREITVSLNPRQLALKRKMFEQFATQQQVLRWFPIDIERFRPAPFYDFSSPPHPGKLYYELFDWGMTGDQWRRMARRVCHSLGVSDHVLPRRVSASAARNG